MNTTTHTEAPGAAAETGAPADAKQPRKRRMAREPKADAAATAGASGIRAAQNTDKPGKPHGSSKIAAVIALLERPEGATLAEMVEATGWLPHTTRASLTGLKKKGHTITKDKRDEVTCYRIAKAGE
ncbi:hypothetical protein A6F68_01089 [Tsuneonella dongtanensis]|uniref:DUF3489 domain-containing protein n=1 Tax=Tsuneonella dongtanensis TaxID=692370 RepID=A0A1B2ABY8_9SPHN|nr:DUF3489 domain-containing protein [Tsuneonella dongtanensis]ANY19608.1 hypothetical protein A6F68_01089 [Tsuneonella dongtanensis]